MEYSCLKTLAGKHRSKVSKIRAMYKDGTGKWAIPYETKTGIKICEVCGCTENDRYEIHHVNKVKNLKGKSEWEKIMIAKRRKTIVVCHKCHMAIHHGEKK